MDSSIDNWWHRSTCEDSQIDSHPESGLESRLEDFNLDTERELSREARRARRASLTMDEYQAGALILFGHSTSESTESNTPNGGKRSPKKGSEAIYKSTFRKPGEEYTDGDDNSDDTEDESQSETDDTEDIPRADLLDHLPQPIEAILYIKMAAYPLSLEQYIVSIPSWFVSSRRSFFPISICLIERY